MGRNYDCLTALFSFMRSIQLKTKGNLSCSRLHQVLCVCEVYVVSSSRVNSYCGYGTGIIYATIYSVCLEGMQVYCTRCYIIIIICSVYGGGVGVLYYAIYSVYLQV